MTLSAHRKFTWTNKIPMCDFVSEDLFLITQICPVWWYSSRYRNICVKILNLQLWTNSLFVYMKVQDPFSRLYKNLLAMVSRAVALSFNEFLYSIIYGSVKICLTALNFKIEWFFTFYFHYIRMSWLLVSREICKLPPNWDLYSIVDVNWFTYWDHW